MEKLNTISEKSSSGTDDDDFNTNRKIMLDYKADLQEINREEIFQDKVDIIQKSSLF